MGKYGYSFDTMISKILVNLENMKQIIVMSGQSVKKKVNRLDRMNCF
jgi:hypothetical protein